MKSLLLFIEISKILLFKKFLTDATYAKTLSDNAESLYRFANTYKGKYSDSIPIVGSFYRYVYFAYHF